MKKQLLILCAFVFMVSNIASADWIASNTTVRPGAPTACNGIEVEGTFSWFTTATYNNDLSFATMKILLPNVVMAATGTPSLVDLTTSLPVPNVSFNLTTTVGGSAWEATFGTGTTIQPFTVLVFTVTDLQVADTTLGGLLVSNTIDFLSSPAGETAGNNGSSVNFGITANPTDLPLVTGNDSLMQADGSTLSYYDTTCRIIATVNDTTGGNVLGNTVSNVTVDATAGFHNGQPYVRRWYQITPTTNGPAEVTLYINQSDFDDYNTNLVAPYDSLPTTASNSNPHIGNIHVTKNDDGGLSVNPIVLIPTSVNWNGTYWEITVLTPSFSQFRVHAGNPGNIPLSVRYKDFTVTKEATSDVVKWTTVSEENNSHFNIQRSADGQSFEKLGTVQSKATGGQSTIDLDYNFVDETPMIGHNYYRLEQVDLNNQLSYTKTIDIIWGVDGSVVSVYPNPAKDILNIDLSTDKVTQTEIKLSDMSGRVIKSIIAQTVKGMNHVTLNIADVAVGVYGVQIFENNKLTHNTKIRKD